jgi:hypothetical protein
MLDPESMNPDPNTDLSSGMFIPDSDFLPSRISDHGFNKNKKYGFAIRQSCGSWLFISDPDFYSSWILDPGFLIHQQQQKRRKFFVPLTFLVATNVTKL